MENEKYKEVKIKSEPSHTRKDKLNTKRCISKKKTWILDFFDDDNIYLKGN